MTLASGDQVGNASPGGGGVEMPPPAAPATQKIVVRTTTKPTLRTERPYRARVKPLLRRGKVSTPARLARGVAAREADLRHRRRRLHRDDARAAARVRQRDRRARQ